MIHTIRVTSRTGDDPLGADVLAEIRRTLGRAEIGSVRTAKVYRIEGVSAEGAKRLARHLLADPVGQRWSLDEPLITDAAHIVEVAYLPGVMNPESASIAKAATDLGVVAEAFDSSHEYAFYPADGAAVDSAAVQEVLSRLLVNPTIERVVDSVPDTLIIQGEPGVTERLPLRDMDDAGMQALSDGGLYLELHEMHAIRDYFVEIQRDPSDLELEVLAQTWSEHCVHKTFKSPLIVDGKPKASLMSRLKTTSEMYSDLIVSAFVDNSGVMSFYDGWAVCGKVETHNSPSAIEPYGGAMTGSGGVFRDILGTGQGADVVASTDMFCFAPPDLPAEDVPPGALPPDYLLRRVVTGVRDYGNRMGIPTNNGSVHFHPDFRAKPTVIVGAYGLIPEAVATMGQPREGDRVIVLGGKTGRDGIHGATFSSVSMTADTISVNAQAVQIGNAVEEKRLLDAVLKCRDAGLIRAITDCGAGGFSSAIGEMGEGIGADIDLALAPLKYAGLAPWEIFVSESQERMVMAIAQKDVERVMSICATYNVEAMDVGSFDGSNMLRVRFGQELVGELDMHFLHDGLPLLPLEATWSAPEGESEPLPAPPADAAAWRRAAAAVMAHPNVCSKEPIVRQYDHTVKAQSAGQPFGGADGDAPSDAIILTPLLGEPYGLIIAHGINPVLNTLDPYWGGVWAAAEAMSNLVASGGNPRETSLIDNFIWPVPVPDQLGGLDRAIQACIDVMHALKRPFISGKDSLSSTYRYPGGEVLHIPPVLCVSVFGRIPDVTKTASTDFKTDGSRIVLVGAADAEAAALGGSTYLDTLGRLGERVPKVDLEILPKTLDAVFEAIRDGHVLACHDVSEGGLLGALVEMGFGGDMGCEVDVAGLAERADVALFGETAGVFVVEIKEGVDITAVFGSVPHAVIGRTTSDEVLRVNGDGGLLFDVPLADLQAAWERPMREMFH